MGTAVEQRLTRRTLLARGAAGSAAVALGGSYTALARASAPAAARPIPLPSPARVRADFQTMVDFGPRLCGSEPHNRYIEWLEREFVAAGCDLVPCDVYQTSRWTMESFALEVLEGAGRGPVRVASYFPRSQQTPAAGVSGPLVFGGTLPPLALGGADVAAVQAAIARYPQDVTSWAQGVSGTLGAAAQGSVMLVDLPMPPPLTQGMLAAGMTYYNGHGETAADLATEDYKRLWTVPGLVLPLDSFTAMGVAGVVFIVDASYDALKGQYAPFEWFNEAVPALYVDRDTGRLLRSYAAGKPRTRLTLAARRETVPTATVTAVLPGRSQETLIFNTHTDGTGFVEENGAVGFVQLARYFGSLPVSQRPKRTLVFAAWPGHFSNDLPQANGWIADHPDLVGRSAAALTVEHLGCSEWNDSTDAGYHATGRPEFFAVWATQGAMASTVQDSIAAVDLPRTGVLRPPAQFGVGGPFQAHGIPQIGALAGPEYLLTVSPSGDMEKLDAALAARQVRWLADLTRRLDGVSAAHLRQGDPTLGGPSTTGNIVPSSAVSKPVACRPAAARAPAGRRRRVKRRRPASGDYLITLGGLVVDYDGWNRAAGGLLLGVWPSHGAVRRVEIVLERGGRVVSRARVGLVDRKHRVVLRTGSPGRRFAAGSYTLVIRGSGRVKRVGVRLR